MKASEILQAGIDAMKDRAAIRDQESGERSAAKAASILRAWTNKDWVEADVWRCLMAVKMARETQGAFHPDDLVDGAAYFALLGECRFKQECPDD
jgi:Domain of unknown function (DUF6378)